MSRIKEFIIGIGYIFKGFRFLGSHPKLWPWAILPTIINLAILGAMIAVLAGNYDELYGWLSDKIGHLDIVNPATWYWHILDGILWILDKIFQLFVLILSAVIMLIISYALSFIVAAPFNDLLSEQVEILVAGKESPPFSWRGFIVNLIRTIKIESIKAAVFIAIPVVLFLLNFIPGFGGLAYLILTFIFGAWDMGFAYADLPMGRKVAPFKDRVDFAMRYKYGLAGLGMGFIVPFFNLLFASPMVVAGTLFYTDKERL